MRIGNLVRDPQTGDEGRVVGFDPEGKPLGRTNGGRLFTDAKGIQGKKPSLADRYWAGELKVCNCAGCKKLLLGSAHLDELDREIREGQDIHALPELVAGRRNGRPYCHLCA